MTESSTLNLQSLPLPFRLGIAALVLTLLGGYIVSGLHLRWHYDNRDETPGLTMNDIIGAYHGVQTPSPLISALESGHPDTIIESERTALLNWLEGDRVSQDYDNLDLGENAPSEIIAMSCLDCHSRSSTGPDSNPDVSLEYWDDIRKLADSKDIQPAGTNIVATSQHVHAPMMAIVMIVLGITCLFTRFSKRTTGWLVFISGLGLLVDMAGWWITREVAHFAYAIVIGGGLYAIGTMLIGCLIMLDCILPAGKQASV
jgi:hypothetical protein